MEENIKNMPIDDAIAKLMIIGDVLEGIEYDLFGMGYKEAILVNGTYVSTLMEKLKNNVQFAADRKTDYDKIHKACLKYSKALEDSGFYD